MYKNFMKQKNSKLNWLYAIMLVVTFLFISCEGSNNPVNTGSRESDSLCLVKIYNECGGKETYLDWDFTKPMDSWSGVILNKAGRVDLLGLGGRNLTGHLDVSCLTELTYLTCYNNNLTSIDVSKNVNLKYLYCYSNNLTSIDVSKNVNLTWLKCKNKDGSCPTIIKTHTISNCDCCD